MADRIMTYLFKNTDKIICVSKYSAEKLAEDFNLNLSEIGVCYSWIPLPEITPEIAPHLKEKIKGKTKILSVGRIIPEKGIGRLLELASYIEKEKLTNKYSITVIGDSSHPIKDELKRASEGSNCLTYLGRVDRPKLWNYFASHNIFILPVKADEGCNRVIIEAYSMGEPVLATDYGSIGEILDIFPVSQLLRGDSAKETLEAIDELMARVKAKGQTKFFDESRKVVADNFSAKNFSVYKKAYISMLSD